MAQLTDEAKERIRTERAILQRGLTRPEVQLVFQKLDKVADDLLLDYDKQDFINRPEKAVYIQCYRDIVKKDIPHIFENIINVDTPRDHARWTFKSWLAAKLQGLADLISAERL